MVEVRRPKMKAKWIKMDISEDLPYLIIESGPTIKELYNQTRHLLQGKGALIIGLDSRSLLNRKERDIFSNQLKTHGILYQVVEPFLWISAEEVHNLFEKSDFGVAADTFFLITKKPDDFKLHKIPRIKGLFRKRFPEELLNILKDYNGSDVIYITSDVPDLLIVTRNKEFLEQVYQFIEIGS
jgi:hypothetical protein